MAQPQVEIYTKWGCPYCVQAKALLDAKGVTYQEYDITLGGPKKAEMQQRVLHLLRNHVPLRIWREAMQQSGRPPADDDEAPRIH